MSAINYFDTLDDWEEIERRSQNQLTKDDGYVPWGTNLVEGAKDLAGRAVGQLQEWAEEDPDTWTDDALRLMGRGVEGAGSAMADWESRSEEGELGLRSAAGTALRFMNWSSEQGARLGRTGARALGVNEELGGFLGSFLPEAIGTKGLSKVAQVGKATKQIRKLRKLGYGLEVDDITKGRHAFAHATDVIPEPSVWDDALTASTANKTARRRLGKIHEQAESANAKIIERQKLGKKLSADIDPDELIRRKTLKDSGFKMDRKQLKSELLELQDKGMSFEDAKKQLLGDEPFWIDNRTGEPIALQYNTKDPTKPYMPGQWSRRQRGGKRTLLTEQQSVGPGETAFTKYNAKTNKVELLVKKGDEIHHWNSIIDKSSAYVGLSTQEAKELTGLVRKSGWMFGDNKANLIKMIRGDHKKIHAFMRESGIEGAKARKVMEKLYSGKSIEERFKILRGFMEHVQGAVDEELVRMGYQIPASHAAAQSANRKVLQTIKMP